MQSVNLNNHSTDNIENKVSQDTVECNTIKHELLTLQQQVTKLNEVIVNLEDAVQMRDLQLENTHRERSRLLAEVKKQKKCNRNLKQQLDDERYFHQREKKYLVEEMQRHRSRHVSNASVFQEQRCRELEQAQATLKSENKRLEEELTGKSEITYNLCIKFLRMKHAKGTLRQKLDQLLHEHLLVMAEMMEKLDEARNELNLIVSEKFQKPLPLSKAKFLQVIQRNNRLVYENATLKVQIHQLTQNMEKLRNEIQRPKKINVYTKIIEKLSMQNNTRSASSKIEKITLLSTLSQPIDRAEDSTVIPHSRNVNNCAVDDAKDAENDLEEFHAERTQSAPGVVETVSRRNG